MFPIVSRLLVKGEGGARCLLSLAHFVQEPGRFLVLGWCLLWARF